MPSLRPRGFTLIEMLIALAVAGILLALAGPNFREAIDANRLTSTANELTAALQLARAEAIRQNRRVVLCRTEDGSSCSAASSTWPGWILFADTDANGVRGAAEPVIKSGVFDASLLVKSSPNISALAERINFRGDGLARAADNQTLLAGTLAVCVAAPKPADNVRDVSLASGSRTRVGRRNGAGACGVPADS